MASFLPTRADPLGATAQRSSFRSSVARYPLLALRVYSRMCQNYTNLEFPALTGLITHPGKENRESLSSGSDVLIIPSI